MSISPSSKGVKETSITSMKVVASGMFYSLRKDPATALFYSGIAFLLIGLPLNVVFPVAYYWIMALLGVILLARRKTEKDAENSEKKK